MSKLNIIHDHKMTFEGECGIYTILGRLSMDLSALRVTIHLQSVEKRKQRLKLDLYNYTQIQKNCQTLSEKENYSYLNLEKDLLDLTDALEKYRDNEFEKEYAFLQPKKIRITKANERQGLSLLKQDDLLTMINRMLEESGIVGEEDNRLLLFLVALGYKSNYPLHALVNSTSGSGKSHLINSVADCFPNEDIISLSRVTSKSLYHYRKGELINKLILIQDFDGLDEEALYGLRELQSYKKLSSSFTYKDKFGNMTSKVQTVESHFSSLGATTKATYTDNESRSILLKIDESLEQTKRIIDFQNNQKESDKKTQNRAKVELSNMIRLLKNKAVHNPFASEIQLPPKAKMLRRLNQQFQDFICQITFINQYQREENKNEAIITTKEDVKQAIELFFDSIWLKIDELDGALRTFYERLKAHLLQRDKKVKATSGSFTQREIRQALGLSQSHCNRHFKNLQALEYIQLTKSRTIKGIQYKVNYWDDYEKVSESIKASLIKQLDSINPK